MCSCDHEKFFGAFVPKPKNPLNDFQFGYLFNIISFTPILHQLQKGITKRIDFGRDAGGVLSITWKLSSLIVGELGRIIF